MRIVHVLQWLEIGGAELVALELARAQRTRGNSVALLVLRGQQGPLAARVKSAEIELLFAGGLPSGRQLRLYPKIARVLSGLQPEVVHTHDPASLLYAAPVARARGAVVVHTKHGRDIAGSRRRLAARVASELAHAVVAVSQDVANIARGTREAPPRKLHVIENGVDTLRFSPDNLRARRADSRRRLGIPEHSLVIGCVARLEPVKRHWLLLEGLLPTLSEVRHLAIFGDGSQREALVTQAGRHPRGRYVVMPGMMDDPLDALSALDAFVLTSSHEGLPLALLEALAAGLPVIASAVGGIPAVVEHGVSGWLVRLDGHAAAQALRSAVDAALANAAQRQRLGEAARSLVQERYSLEQTCSNYLELYRSVRRPC